MIAFRVTVPAVQEELATTLLWEEGTEGIEIQPGPANGVVLLSYFHERVGLHQTLSRTLAVIPDAVLEPAAVPEVDWVARVREGFRGCDAGTFAIRPAWDAGTSTGKRRLLVEPGRAFGTGTHETTRLCLLALERCAPARGRLLDLGTGSGILAVAACLLGFGPVVAVDVDAEAVASARHHAALNGVSFALLRGDGGRGLRPGSFDCVLANLTLGLLLERRDEIADLARSPSVVILSGFLVDDLPALQDAYRALGPVDVEVDGEWAAAIVRRGGR